MKNEKIMTHYSRMLKKYNAKNLEELSEIVPKLYYNKRMELLSLKQKGIQIKEVEKQANSILHDQKAIEILQYLHREL